MQLIDYTGQTVGRLTVVGPIKNEKNRTFWKCECECGNETLVSPSNLRNAKVRSCGCLLRDFAKQNAYRHGSAKRGQIHPEYRIYLNMVNRCYRVKDVKYHRYGGRGITVHPDWLLKDGQGYKNFIEHIGRRPSDDHSIDRIDNDGNYEPGNVRWATRVKQSQNKDLYPNNKTGISGVQFRDDGFRVRITVDRERINLGQSKDFFEACCIRKSAEVKYNWRNV